MQADSKFRNYASLMDKALRSFEYTNEWADLISALAKINKVKIRLWSSNRLRYMLFLISELYLLYILLYVIVIYINDNSINSNIIFCKNMITCGLHT